MASDEVDVEKLDITDELIAERHDFVPGQTPEEMTSWQRPITAVIDIVNLWAGRIIALMLVPLIAIVVYEVFSRNIFAIMVDNGMEELAKSIGLGPTLWAYDMSRMIAGVIFMAAAGYGLMRGVHIRADFLYRNWTAKTQATVDASLYLLFFIPLDDPVHLDIGRVLVGRLLARGNHGHRQRLGAFAVASSKCNANRRISVVARRNSGGVSRLPQDG